MQEKSGTIEVVVGSMFSGKTEELIRLIRRAHFAKQNFQVFKPRVDARYSEDHVASHDRSLIKSQPIDRAYEIFSNLKANTQVIGIDEAQFFDSELVDVVNELADRGLRVIIAGLDMNWKGEPFHPMPELMAIADTVRKLQAVCVQCGATASRTQRLIDTEVEVLVGGSASYEPRCRSCFTSDLHQGISQDDFLDDSSTDDTGEPTLSEDQTFDRTLGLKEFEVDADTYRN